MVVILVLGDRALNLKRCKWGTSARDLSTQLRDLGTKGAVETWTAQCADRSLKPLCSGKHSYARLIAEYRGTTVLHCATSPPAVLFLSFSLPTAMIQLPREL